MANFRSVEENFFNQLPSTFSDSLLQESFESREETFKENMRLFSFGLSNDQKKYLTNLGITLAPVATQTHNHPVSKIIENWILFKILPNALFENMPVIMLSIKRDKAKYFYNRANLGGFDPGLIFNKIIEAKDGSRYQGQSVIHSGVNDHEAFCLKLKQRLNRNIGNMNVVIHDEVHHWGIQDFSMFLDSLRPTQVLFTFIYPAELLDGEKSSMNSVAYSFKTKGDEFHYFPDGKGSEPYIQKKSNNWPLFTGSVKIDNGRDEVYYYTITKLATFGAHHLFSAVRGRMMTEGTRYFNDFDMARPSIIKCLFTANGRVMSIEPRLRLWVIEKVVSYIVCLKKPDVESALAKLRQLSDFNLSMQEIKLIAAITDMLISYKSTGELTLTDFVKNPISSTLLAVGCSNSLISRIGCRDFVKKLILDELLTEGAKYEVVVNVKDVSIRIEEPDHCVRRGRAGESLWSRWLNAAKDGSYRLSGPLDLCDCWTQVGSFSVLERLRFKHLPNHGGLNHRLPRLEGLKPNVINEEDLRAVQEGSSLQGEVKEQEIIGTTSNVDAQLDIPKSVHLIHPSERTFRNSCFFFAVAPALGLSGEELISQLTAFALRDEERLSRSSYMAAVLNDLPLNFNQMEDICKDMGWYVKVHMGSEVRELNRNDDLRAINIGGRPGHLYEMKKRMDDNASAAMAEVLSQCYVSTYGIKSPTFKRDRFDMSRAKTLLKAFRSLNFGALIDRVKINRGELLNKEWLNFILNDENDDIDYSSLIKVDVLPFIGFAGSGKTHNILSKLIDGQEPGSFMFISARKEGINQIYKKLSSRSESERTTLMRNFKTFELGLLGSETPSLVILDECGLLPQGYLDLVILKKISEKFKKPKEFVQQMGKGKTEFREPIRMTFVITGDILQSTFHSDSCTKLNGLQNELFYHLNFFNKKEVGYLFGTRRFGTPSEDFLRLPYYGDGDCQVKFLKGLAELDLGRYVKEAQEKRIIALVASQLDKGHLSETCLNVMTIGESQGCTFDYVVLYLTPDFFRISLEMAVVSMTRQRKGIMVVFDEKFHCELDSRLIKNSHLSPILARDFSFMNGHIEKKIEHFHVVSDQLFGHDFEIKMSGDPFLKSMLYMIEPAEPEKVEIEEIDLMKVNQKTHIPIENSQGLLLQISERMAARENREFMGYGKGCSTQFKEAFNGNENNESSQAMSYEAVFPKHSSSDSCTFWAAVRKRIKMSDPRKNLARFRQKRHLGKIMLDEFIKHIKVKKNYSNELMEESAVEFEQKKISKSAALIENHHARSLSDWNFKEVFVFMKSQLCTKKDKMFCEAKAGQTLACFSHAVLVHFAPMARYVEKKVTEALPKNFYIHQKKNFDELDKWVKANDFNGECTESDYEAFDSSQDEITLAFEVALLEFLEIDKGLIEDYIWLKTNLDSKLGTMAVMRFTGEFGTFLFNTLTNMVFTFMKYDIHKGTALCFAGDDMCANKRLKKKKEFDSVLNQMSLKAKVCYTEDPTFCGWLLTEDGILKSPSLIEARLMVAKEKGLLESVMDSYFLEYSYAFRMGDNLMKHLDDEELGYHYSITRFFVKHKHMLKGESRKILESSKEMEHYLYGELVFGSCSIGIMQGMSRNLGHPVRDVISKTCPSYQSESFSTLSALAMNQFISTPFIQATFTQIHPLSEVVRALGSERFKTPFQFQHLVAQELSALKYQLSTMEKLNTSSQEVKNSDSYISEQSSLVSHAYSKWINPLVERSCTTTQDSETPNKQLKQVSSSTYRGVKLTSYISLIIQYQQWIQTLTLRAGSNLILKVYPLLKGPMHSIWTLVVFTGSQTKLTLSALGQSCVRRGFRSFLGLKEYISLMTGSVKSLMISMKVCLLPLLTQGRLASKKASEMLSRTLLKGIEVSAYFLRKSAAVAMRRMIDCWPHLRALMAEAIGFSKNQIPILITTLRKCCINAVEQMKKVKGPIKILIGHVTKLVAWMLKMAFKLGRVFLVMTIATMVYTLKMLISSLGQLRECLKTKGEELLKDLEEEEKGKEENQIDSQEESLNMSLVKALHDSVRRGIEEVMWDMVDHNNVFHLVPAEGTELSQAQRIQKRAMLNHYLDYMVGNVAIFGTSKETQFLNMSVPVPRLNISDMEMPENWQPNTNLAEFVRTVEAWASVHADENIRKMTRRQLFEPVAIHAMHFLQMDPINHVTNIARKRAYLCRKAPEVAFDFASGLSGQVMTDSRAQVISALNSSLFRTEGQKGVFEAKGTVEMNFDG